MSESTHPTHATRSPPSSTADRRTQDRARVPHEAIVAVDGASTGAFEAETVDVSATGMHLRTAYLPEVGTPLCFRFEPTDGAGAVSARGVVVWAQDGNEGREFGVRFEGLEASGADAIRKIVNASHEARAAGMKTDRAGASLRIHLEGVGSPMRATLRGVGDDGAMVSSDLRTLALGSAIELEDRELGERRRARIEAVGCEIDGVTRIPQLIVRVRFEDATSSRTTQLKTEAFPLTTRASQAPSRPLETNMDAKIDAKTNTDASAGPTSVQARMALPVSSEPIEDSVVPPKVDAAPVAHVSSPDVIDDTDQDAIDEESEDDREVGRFGSAANGARKMGERMKDVLE
ncbi:MAG: PilZ domain-containing protein, partial [Polyangiales bacterium]